MGNDQCSSPQGLVGSLSNKPTEVTIRRASNGFLVNARFGDSSTMIANTLAEALELARKSIE